MKSIFRSIRMSQYCGFWRPKANSPFHKSLYFFLLLYSRHIFYRNVCFQVNWLNETCNREYRWFLRWNVRSSGNKYCRLVERSSRLSASIENWAFTCHFWQRSLQAQKCSWIKNFGQIRKTVSVSLCFINYIPVTAILLT